MKILVTGRGSSGSWQIRGEQLGNAIGATVIPNASIDQQKGYDITVCVKHPPKEWKPSGKVVWDMVDPWPQPAGNSWSLEQLVHFIEQRKQALGAEYTIAATQQMRIDTKANITLYHHYKPDIRKHGMPDPTAPIKSIGYEGNPAYLGEWADILTEECEARGWDFYINPPVLKDCGILVGLRGGQWRGVATDRWKSNVKQANAQALGIPFIGLPESGYDETVCMGDYQITLREGLQEAVAFSTSRSKRAREVIAKYRILHAEEYSLQNIAKEYREWLESL